MRIEKIQHVLLAIVVSLIVLISRGLSSETDVNVPSIEPITDIVMESYGEKISSDNIEIYQDAADGNVWRSMNLFVGAEQVICSGRGENRTYFISILAVFFKIAVIPSIIMLITWVVDQSHSDVLGRMMRFVHDSDGKKNK